MTAKSRRGPDHAPPRPRWVKVTGIIAVILVALVAAALLTGHGPGRHTGSSHPAGQSGHAP